MSSVKFTQRLLEKADIIRLEEGDHIEVSIPKHFAYSNKRGDFSLTDMVVEIGKDHNGLDTEYLEGKWLVTKTAMEGGGTGHGPHDTYPDGHHVYCVKVTEDDEINEDIKGSFYQTGSFQNKIPKGTVEIIGRANIKYELGN